MLSVIERALAGETGRYFDGDHVSETEASASRPELHAWVRQRALELSAPYRESRCFIASSTRYRELPIASSPGVSRVTRQSAAPEVGARPTPYLG